MRFFIDPCPYILLFLFDKFSRLNVFTALNRPFSFFQKMFFVSGLLLLLHLPAFAVPIKGIVLDLLTALPLQGVSITNVHSSLEVHTDEKGSFELEVAKGELVEFRIAGYDVARVRIKSEQNLPFYKIQLKEALTLIENQLAARDYFMGAKIDSIKRHELYQQALDHYKLTGLDIIQHPFDAMSKRNRMIWAFQKNYEIWEKDKFVDYVFNDRLIVQLSGLDEESLEQYKKRYRPPYELIRGMNEYQYYSYIKDTVKDFRLWQERLKNPDTKPYNFDR